MTAKLEQAICHKEKDRHTKHWTWAVYGLVEHGECRTENEAFDHMLAVKHQIEQGQT